MRAGTRVNVLCAVAHKTFYVLFSVMRCRNGISLRSQGRSIFLQRIMNFVHSDRRYAISSLLSRYDLPGVGSVESKSATAFAFLSRSISA